MSRPIKLAPSSLAADFLRLGEQVAEAEPARADPHVDVMDGHLTVAAGADVLVAGSAIFNDGESVTTAMQRPRSAVQL
jgi:pentose-5-phosphate-3-epimerase